MTNQRTETAEREATEQVIDAPTGGEMVLAERAAFDPGRQPVWKTLHDDQKDLLKSLSPHCNERELAQGVELAAAYQLDPYAREVWFTKSVGKDGKPGKLLIMVGRDGLRKIAQRNGLEVDGDVVREHDEFTVTRDEKRERTIRHAYSEARAEDQVLREGQQSPQGSRRGRIVGAWAEVFERKTGRQRGFFYAPLSEYLPSNVSVYSPWSKQVSVMILAAAERQALRQGTPLGGLLVEGEDEVINSTAVEIGPPTELPESVRQVVERAQRLGHHNLGDTDTVAMQVGGQEDDMVAAFVEQAHRDLDAMEREEEGWAEAGDPAAKARVAARKAQQTTAESGPRTPARMEGASDAVVPDVPLEEPTEVDVLHGEIAEAREEMAQAEATGNDASREAAAAQLAEANARLDALEAAMGDALPGMEGT